MQEGQEVVVATRKGQCALEQHNTGGSERVCARREVQTMHSRMICSSVVALHL